MINVFIFLGQASAGRVPEGWESGFRASDNVFFLVTVKEMGTKVAESSRLRTAGVDGGAVFPPVPAPMADSYVHSVCGGVFNTLMGLWVVLVGAGLCS